jgi:hypothetical protein
MFHINKFNLWFDLLWIDPFDGRKSQSEISRRSWTAMNWNGWRSHPIVGSRKFPRAQNFRSRFLWSKFVHPVASRSPREFTEKDVKVCWRGNAHRFFARTSPGSDCPYLMTTSDKMVLPFGQWYARFKTVHIIGDCSTNLRSFWPEAIGRDNTRKWTKDIAGGVTMCGSPVSFVQSGNLRVSGGVLFCWCSSSASNVAARVSKSLLMAFCPVSLVKPDDEWRWTWGFQLY